MADPIRIPLTVSEPSTVPLNLQTGVLPKIIEGISPEVTLESTDEGVLMSVTDKTGTETALIPKGEPGAPGEPGEPGQPGNDGVSPTITVTDITGGHRVTITDATGEHSFDVMDGETGGAEIDDTAGVGGTDVVWSADKSSSEIGAKYTKPSSGIPASDLASGVIPSVPVRDVQVNGRSIVTDGVANVPKAASGSGQACGVVMANTSYGTNINSSGAVILSKATDADLKSGIGQYRPVTPSGQHASTFYGFAKAAGDSTQSASSNAVGNYTETAKSAISQMLSAPVTVSGTTPSINAMPGVRYICGECATLDITVPASGDVEVIFNSGSTATVLTVTPPTGVTAVKWANGFDPTALDANTRYDIIITDGEWGLAASWT